MQKKALKLQQEMEKKQTKEKPEELKALHADIKFLNDMEVRHQNLREC